MTKKTVVYLTMFFVLMVMATKLFADVGKYKIVIGGSNAVCRKPSSVSIDGKMQFVYVVCSTDNRIKFIETISGIEWKMVELPEGSRPAAAAADRDTKMLYVSLAGTGEVAAVDIASGTVAAKISVGGKPGEMAAAPWDDNTVLVADEQRNTIQAVRFKDGLGEIAATAALEITPYRAAADEKNNKVYFSDKKGEKIAVISAGLKVEYLPLGVYPGGIAVDGEGGKLYAASPGNGKILVLDTASGKTVKTIDAGKYPKDVAFDRNSKKLLVADFEGKKIFLIDPESGTIVGEQLMNSEPDRIAIFMNGMIAAITMPNEDTIDRLMVGGDER